MIPAAQRGLFIIALATGVGAMSVTLWFPFLPLFLLEIGARNDSDAAFWMAMALTGQGVGRLLAGPVWGVVSDRVGRRAMFLRALFATGVITLGSCAVSAPWQLVITLTLFGLLSGFTPAAIALASVSVPDASLKSAISTVSTGQYVGQAIGPAIGAGLAILVGYRGSLAVSGLAVIAVAFAVVRYVPRDSVGTRSEPSKAKAGEGDATRTPVLEPFRMTLQLAMPILVCGILFGLGGFRSVSTAIALKQLDASNAIAHTGIAFALVGLAGALGVVMVSSAAFRNRRLRSVLAVSAMLSAGSYVFLSLSTEVAFFIAALTLASLLNAAMIPATNTLIAMNAPRSRRGTAFGFASGAQAVGTMAGPLAAAAFAATSLELGFAVVGGLMAILAALIALVVKEPAADKASSG